MGGKTREAYARTMGGEGTAQLHSLPWYRQDR